jgi:hypothetical protein
MYKHDDGELEIAEMACADRCVTKFMQAQNLVRMLFLSAGVFTRHL